MINFENITYNEYEMILLPQKIKSRLSCPTPRVEIGPHLAEPEVRMNWKRN